MVKPIGACEGWEVAIGLSSEKDLGGVALVYAPGQHDPIAEEEDLHLAHALARLARRKECAGARRLLLLMAEGCLFP